MCGLRRDSACARATSFKLECHPNFHLARQADRHFHQSCKPSIINRPITLFVNQTSSWFCTREIQRLLTTSFSRPQLLLINRLISVQRNLLRTISS